MLLWRAANKTPFAVHRSSTVRRYNGNGYFSMTPTVHCLPTCTLQSMFELDVQCNVNVELGQNSLEVSLHKPDHTSIMNIIIVYSIRQRLCGSIGSVVRLV